MTDAEFQRIGETLSELGVSTRTKGFRFFTIARRLYVENIITDPELLHKITQKTALISGESKIAVERNMYDTLNTGWPRRNVELANSIFGSFLQSEADVPSVSLYISMIGEWIL